MKAQYIRRAFAAAAVMVLASWGAGEAQAHGGVKLEQDSCVLKIGPSTMHFIGYQRTGEEQEFCEDIAQTGPTLIALSAVSEDLRDMAIGMRIIKDAGEEQEKNNLDTITVANFEPKVYRNGIMSIEHDFKDAGHYVGIVTVQDELGNKWVSRFPFTVGVFSFMAYIEYILYAVAFTALCAGMWFYLGTKKRQQQAHDVPAATLS